MCKSGSGPASDIAGRGSYRTVPQGAQQEGARAAVGPVVQARSDGSPWRIPWFPARQVKGAESVVRAANSEGASAEDPGCRGQGMAYKAIAWAARRWREAVSSSPFSTRTFHCTSGRVLEFGFGFGRLRSGRAAGPPRGSSTPTACGISAAACAWRSWMAARRCSYHAVAALNPPRDAAVSAFVDAAT